MTRIEYLDQQVKVVYPAAEGISIGNPNDRTTWKVHPVPSLPSVQAAVQAIFDSYQDTLLPPPIDLSSVDNIEKGMKALALCVAQVGGLTVPQLKTLFKQKWDSLP